MGFPWNLQAPIGGVGPMASMPTISFADISAAGGPADQWDALPTAAKLQILGVIGFLEMWSETSAVLKMDGEEHYVRGGKPGYFPKLSRSDDMAFPHPVPLNLWDPCDDRHLRSDLSLEGPPGSSPRRPWHQAICGRDHGSLLRWRCFAAVRCGHAQGCRHPRLLGIC